MASIPLMFAQDDVEFGGKPVITEDFAYNNNVKQAGLKIRLGFLRKVYGLLTGQLLITVVVATVCMTSPPVRAAVHNNDWLLSIAFILSLVILVALHIKKRETPTNFILLGCFTVVQAYTIGVVLTYFEQAVVLQAFVITLAVVAGLTAFTFQTKKDFSFLGLGLFAGLCVLMVGGLLQIFIGSTALELLLSAGGAFLFSLFIIYDTQMLMEKLSAEEYILATINLYLDIINLFLYILRLLEAARRH
ncbi:protein lifeguard 4-like [Schistocerca nitens]|uniref:protein lifeguard 4-like n=1 Tax=Schistocerca cancellata TaxID=274614 RepID=UPI00211887F2|nr:protein lifeguard 4-like [Schistocerca cancellata]XP_049809759.1 protein lifeguard 4-like [Schistocerca nitens]XP_049859202.1 protein lifeguard 4-like [Schistocerca gregaria]